jgi:hypothetical protein
MCMPGMFWKRFNGLSKIKKYNVMVNLSGLIDKFNRHSHKIGSKVVFIFLKLTLLIRINTSYFPFPSISI